MKNVASEPTKSTRRQTTRRATPVEDLWIVTSYFNPVGYRSRLHNYEVFSDHIRSSGLPLMTIECAFGAAPFTLPSSPAIMQVRSRDVMWQKERLLNLAIERLPATCTKVAWVDCDVLFDNPDWAATTSRLLDEHPVVQPYEVPTRLLRDGRTPASNLPWKRSFAADYAADRLATHTHLHPRRDDTGLAWAARREILATHGIYDASIAGGADHLVAHAMCDDWESHCIDRICGVDTSYRRHAQAWGRRFYPSIRGDIQYVEGGVRHLWHGDYFSRDYVGRHRALQRFEFDPRTDLRLGPSGCWEWASPKEELHRWVAEYFARRNEDGEDATTPLRPEVRAR